MRVVCLVTLLTGQIFALQQAITFEKIPLYEGQHLLTVFDITQDSVGYVWFASNKGMFRYDGYRFKHYILEKDKNITWNSKVMMTVDPQGNLWAVFQHSLYKYNPVKESFEPYQVNGYQNRMRFYSIASDSSYIWLGNNKGLIYQIDKKTFELNKLNLKKDQYQNKILILGLSITDSLLWIGSNIGLHKYNYCKSDTNKGPIKILFPSDNLKLYVRGLLIDGNNLFFGSTECKLNHFENGTFRQHDWSNKKRPNCKLETSRINSMCFDNNKNIWIASNSAGVLFFNRKSKRFSSSCIDTDLFQGLKPDPFETIFVDKSGIVWVSRAGQGIFRSVIPPFKVTNYETIINPADSCRNEYLTNITELSNGTMVFSIDQNGLLFFDPIYNTFSFVKHEKGKLNTLPCNDISAMICDKKDNLWLGSPAGLIRYDIPHNLFEQYFPEPDSVHSHYFTQTKNKNYISSLCAYSDSILWVSTNNGIYKFNTSRQVFTEKYSTDSLSYIIPEKSIQQRAKPTCLEKDGEDILWVGTATAGIFLFDPDKRKFIKQYLIKRTTLSPIVINDIHCDSKKQIWVSSHTSGIFSFDSTTGEFINFSNQRGMISAGVDKFIEDSLSNLWLCCPNGVMLFNSETSTFTYFNQKDNFHFHVHKKNDGLNTRKNPGYDKNGKFISSKTSKTRYTKSKTTGYTCRDGTLYFAGPNGFTQIRPDFLNQESNHKVYLSGFNIFNEPVHFDKPLYEVEEIKLSFKDYIFSFEFMFTNTGFVDRNKFAYWLQGFEKDWQYTGSNNTREYFNIPPGNYTMLVKACSAYGIWTKPLSINIIITPPFWQTWWFRISLFLFMAGVIGLIFWVREKNLQRQKNLLEIQVKERTNELHKSNKKLVDEIRFRRKVEKELRKSEEEYRDLFENAYDVIWISDPEGNIQAANHYLASLLGYSRNEIIGKNLLDFISPEHRFRAIRFFKTFQQKGFCERELNFQTKERGTRILWTKIRAIKEDGKIVGIHGIGRDSTELRKAQAELQEAERMKRESIKQLTLKIAHEIKNPLASISSSAQLVASSKDYRGNPKIQRHMNVINKSVNTCNQVIRELYTFTHKPAMNFANFPINGLIEAVLAATESRLATLPNIKLIVKKDINNGTIHGDKFRLEQTLMNLINNAIDAMTDKGILSIHLYRSENRINIDISDTGCGMSQETIKKLFTPFFTSKSTGFGLGMSIVKDIIDAHHATINVKSEVNKGTRFTVSFEEIKKKEI